MYNLLKSKRKNPLVALPGNWLIILAFVAIYFIWGSTYLAALIGLEGFPPFILAGCRFLLAGAILLAWCLARGESLPGFRGIFKSGVSGILMLGGGTGSVIWAEQYISSGLVAILIAIEPFWFIVLDRKSWSAYFANKWILIGLFVGLIGFLQLFVWPQESSQGSNPPFDFPSAIVVLAGGMSWVVGSLYTKYQPTTGSTWLNSSLQLLMAGVFCLFLSVVLQEWKGFVLTNVSVSAWLALVYMAIMGSILAYTAYLWLLTVRPPAVVGTHTYVNPIVAVILGWIFASEPVLLSQILALFLILAGMVFVNLPTYQKLP